jgi:hypothetical protein
VKSELIRGHVERSKNSQIFFRNLIDSIENTISDVNENEYLQDDDFDLMIVASEETNHSSKH